MDSSPFWWGQCNLSVLWPLLHGNGPKGSAPQWCSLVFRPKSPRLDSIGMSWSQPLLLLRNWIKEKWKRELYALSLTSIWTIKCYLSIVREVRRQMIYMIDPIYLFIYAALGFCLFVCLFKIVFVWVFFFFFSF